MKNLVHSLIFLFALHSFSSFAQYTDIGGERFDTTLTKTWDNGNWVIESRSFNDYNTDCNINSTTIQSRENNAWMNSSRSTYTYLPSKKVNQSFSYFWDDPDWVLIGRTTNTYNASLQLIKDLTEVNVNDIWMGQSQNIYTYDGNGYLITEVTQTWDGALFQNSNRTDYRNNSGGMVTDERAQNWNGTTWINNDSTHYEYNGTMGVSSSISFVWNVNVWVNSDRSTGTYVNNFLTQVIDEEWINNAWRNSDKTTLKYDGNGRIISLLDQIWDVPAQNWVNVFLDEFSYTSECSALPLTLLQFNANVKSGDVFLQWETTNEINTSGFTIQKSTDGITFKSIGTVPSTGGKFINKYFYKDRLGNDQAGILYYRLLMNDIDGKSTISDVEKVKVNPAENITLFPNPVKDQLNFVLPASVYHTNVRILNQSGSTVINHEFENITEGVRNSIDVSVLQKGLYILQINNGKTIVIKKFMKQ